MKVNFTFKDDIFSDNEYRLTVYCDDKKVAYRISDAIGEKFVITNCFLKEDSDENNSGSRER